uniref:Uncharacterized protein n=1 Tax=Anguilla anguilla TaxID=7936 RepID=A0A0E9VPY3_ANGAN
MYMNLSPPGNINMAVSAFIYGDETPHNCRKSECYSYTGQHRPD